jgi:CRP/FNR family transcriptional regulator, cyclic AMP receptor protein
MASVRESCRSSNTERTDRSDSSRRNRTEIPEGLNVTEEGKEGAQTPEDIRFDRLVRVYQRSEVIFEEGSVGAEMYIVRSGAVKLVVNKNGRKIVLATLGPGQFFGEMAIVDSTPRSASAVADEDDTHLLALNQEKFLYLAHQQPAFTLTIIYELSQRIRLLDAIIAGEKRMAEEPR